MVLPVACWVAVHCEEPKIHTDSRAREWEDKTEAGMGWKAAPSESANSALDYRRWVWDKYIHACWSTRDTGQFLTWNTFLALPSTSMHRIGWCLNEERLEGIFFLANHNYIRTALLIGYGIFQAKFGANSPVEALREVRKTKDNWKGWWHPWLPLLCWTSMLEWANAETLPCRW